MRKILLVILCLVSLEAWSQIKEIGLPIVINYPHDLYQAATQNWGITQDDAGIMYFANNDGVLRFNGRDWNLFPLPNHSKVRSVIWSKGRLYAGGYDEFGYFEHDEHGRFRYFSLSEGLDSADASFDEVWRIYETRHGIVFQSFIRIFIVGDEGIEVLRPQSMFGFSYYPNDQLFIIDRDRGLYLMTENGLMEVYEDPLFFRENEIAFILSTGLNEYLLGTTNKGIFRFDGRNLDPWEAGINERLKRDQIYSGLLLNNEQIAIGTTQNGLYIIDREGEIIMHVNRQKGLQGNTVLSMHQDRYRNLWLGFDNGIDALEISSPLSLINYSYGIETAYTSIVYKGLLYIGTNQGLFAIPMNRLQNRYSTDTGFRLVNGVVGQVWSLGEFNGRLVCGNNLGTFIVEEYDSYQISDRMGGWTYLKVPGRDDLLIGGTYTGLQLYRYHANSRYGWQESGYFSGFEESCREMAFDENNFLWITHEYKGVFRLRLSPDLTSVVSISRYSESAGLPVLPYSVSRMEGELVLTTSQGIYSYDVRQDTFQLNEELNTLLDVEPGLTRMIMDEQEDIWLFNRVSMSVLRKQEDGSYTRITSPFNRIDNHFLGSSFENVYAYDRENAFIGGEQGMLHYNPSIQKDLDEEFQVFIGEVGLIKAFPDSILHQHGGDSGSFVLPYRANSLSFRFFAPYFEGPGHNSFSVKLKGYDETWSEWTPVNFKEYTNLPPGDYEFSVRARNVHSNVSETTPFYFTVTPPWYRSRLALAVYATILLMLVSGILLIFRRRIIHTRSVEQERFEKEMKEKEDFYLEGVKLSEQEIERLKNEKLMDEMRHKNMELANSTMYLVQKNKFLNKIKEEIHDLISNLNNETNKQSLRLIVHRIDRDLKSRQHWKLFDQYFDEVHEDFLNRIKEKHPDLTPKDLRMCAYLKMNLSTKEIAPLMNISVRGVEISRYRLRKKMDLDKDINLTEYILSV